MSPLDHELRAALTSRAVTLTPAVDPLAGIEARAGQLRRRKLAGSVAGTALAVALVAVGVPAAIGSSSLVPPSPELAATSAAPAPSPSLSPVPRDPFVLDPAQPWELRGDADLVDEGALAEWYATGHGDDWTVTALWAQVYEPSAQPETAWLAVRGDEVRWGVVQGEPGAYRPVADLPVPSRSQALQTVLAGDEAPRLLVLAAPQAADVLYSLTGAPDTYRPITPADPDQRGTGLVALEGADLSRDRVQVLQQVGDAPRVVAELPVPDPVQAPVESDPPVVPTRTPTSAPVDPPATSRPPVAPTTPTTTTPPPGTTPARPANLLGWPARGTTPSPADLAAAKLAYATAFGRADEAEDVSLAALYAGDLELGTRFLVGQAWFPGEPARSYGWAAPTEAGELVQISPATEAGTVVLAFLITGLPGSNVDKLIVVPEPGTGQVEYGQDDATEFRAEGEVFDGVWHIDRDPQATTDQLRVLDGDGDLDDPTFQGPVRLLLCGNDSCS